MSSLASSLVYTVITMSIKWSNCPLCCQMNFWKANCMTSLLWCLIHSQAFRLMELYWFVCCSSNSTALLSTPLCLPPSLSVCSLPPPHTLLLSPPFHHPQRLDVLTSIYSMSPPEGGAWDSVSCTTDTLACVYMPDSSTVQVPVRGDHTAADLLSAACKVGLAASVREMTGHKNDATSVLT